jgi:RNA polymerase sigma-70 factor (ECF subfamily)
MNAAPEQSMIASTDSREEAIPRLMDLYGGFLYQLSQRLCRSSADAEDLIQETLLQAFRKWHQFRGESDPKTWLYTIATRLSKRMYQKRAGEPSRIRSLDEPAPSGESAMTDVAADQPTVLSQQIHREGHERIEQAIVSLPEECRVPFVLKDVFEFSAGEIADVLGLKEAAAKSRIRRARLSIKEELAKGRARDLPPLSYSKQVCRDLMRARKSASDRGVAFPMADESLCRRCLTFFSTVDLIQEQSRNIAAGKVWPDVPEKQKA